MDFAGGLDRIEIASGARRFGQFTIKDIGADVEISWANTKVIVEDMHKSDFGGGDFIFS